MASPGKHVRGIGLAVATVVSVGLTATISAGVWTGTWTGTTSYGSSGPMTFEVSSSDVITLLRLQHISLVNWDTLQACAWDFEKPLSIPVSASGTFSGAVRMDSSDFGATIEFTFQGTLGSGPSAVVLHNFSYRMSCGGKSYSNQYATDYYKYTVSRGAPSLSATASASTTSGKPPLTVGFSGSAANGKAPYTYLWGFGDNSPGSNDQNPTHIYANTGTYSVTLEVTDSDSAKAVDSHLRITVASGVAASWWLPVASHSSGAVGSRWRTDVGVLNTSKVASVGEVRYYSSTGAASKSLRLEGLEQAELGDVVEMLGGGNGSGAVEVRLDEKAIVTSRTFNQTDSGTFGQNLDGYPSSQGLKAGESGWLPQLKETQEFRTNIALTNTGSTLASVRVTLYEGRSGVVTSYTVDLTPGQWQQENRPFRNRAGRTDVAFGYARVEVLAGSGILTYASVIDSRTNDPTTVVVSRSLDGVSPARPDRSEEDAAIESGNGRSAGDGGRLRQRVGTPRFFVKNVGQYPSDVRYVLDTPAARWVVRTHDIVVQWVEPDAAERESNSLSSRFSDPRAPVPAPDVPRRLANVFVRFPEGRFDHVKEEAPLGGVINVFKGMDPTRWFTHIPALGRVRIQDVYDGLDLVLDASEEHGVPWYLGGARASSTVRLTPDVDTRGAVDFGARAVSFDLPFGRRSLPYPEVLPDPASVASRSQMPTASGGTCAKPDGVAASAAQELVWSTYLGGTGNSELVTALVVDPSDNPIVGFYTNSSNVPTPNGYDTTLNGRQDIYIVKLSEDGARVIWGTYIGGSGDDSVTDLALDGAGNLVLLGVTDSPNMPTPGGYDSSYHGGKDAYVAKLSAGGDALMWGTYLGGSKEEYGEGIAVTSDGDVVVGLDTASSDIPVPGGYDSSFNGGSYDLYIARLSSSGAALRWGTFLGGSDSDRLFGGLALDAAGNVVLAADTKSSGMPVPGGFGTTKAGGDEVYVAKLGGSGSTLLWATYLGGRDNDNVRGLVLDGNDNPLIVGFTDSYDFPTQGGYDRSRKGTDAFAAKLAANGSALVWGTYVGGWGSDAAYSCAADSAGNLVVAGWTDSTDLATSSGFDRTRGGNSDGFVAKVAATGSSLLWATYFGGSSYDSAELCALDSYERVIIAGTTFSKDIPALGGYRTVPDGSLYEFFTAKLTDPAQPDCSPLVGSPTLTLGTPTASAVPLGWNALAGATGFKLYRGTTKIYEGSARSFTDSGLLPRTQYCYSVRGKNACGDGPLSSSSCATTSAVWRKTWLPVASHTSGLAGSQWRTDLGVLNVSAAAASGELRFYSTSGMLTKSLSIAGGEQTELGDVVGLLGGSGSGAVEVRADGPVIVTSRTFNLSTAGTYGQNLDGFASDQGLRAGEIGWLAQLKETVDYRTNIALTNTGEAPATVVVKLYDGMGRAIGSYTVGLGAGEWKQENRPFLTKAGKSDLARG